MDVKETRDIQSVELDLLAGNVTIELIDEYAEVIRREALQSVRKEMEEWRDDITCCDYDEGYLDGTENALKIIDAAILSAEPAQDDGNSEVEKGDIVAYVFDDGEYTVEQDFSDGAIGLWRDRLCRHVIIMRSAEVERRIEEVK